MAHALDLNQKACDCWKAVLNNPKQWTCYHRFIALVQVSVNMQLVEQRSIVHASISKLLRITSVDVSNATKSPSRSDGAPLRPFVVEQLYFHIFNTWMRNNPYSRRLLVRPPGPTPCQSSASNFGGPSRFTLTFNVLANLDFTLIQFGLNPTATSPTILGDRRCNEPTEPTFPCRPMTQTRSCEAHKTPVG